MSWRASTRRMVRRGLLGFLLVQISAIASLMAADRVRRFGRDANTPALEAAPPQATEVPGSTLTSYTHGEQLFTDMIAAIESATQRVLLESYIIKNDATGRAFKQALVDAADRGVKVYVIYDRFANLVVRPSFFTFPRREDGRGVVVFGFPLWNLGWQIWKLRLLGRDHRKILVVDDRTAFVGGYNIGALYATEWRDTHLLVTGAAVWDVDNAFIDFWNLAAPRHLPRLGPLDDAAWAPQVRAHRNVPSKAVYPIRNMYLEAIDRAHHSIDITAAYFIPDHDILNGLLEAVTHRGVRVRILVPEVSNHVVTDWLSRGFYSQLLDAGVEIHRFQDHMVHAKTATIDGQWSTVGTANIDRLSLLGNYEINLEIIDPAFARHMQEVFETDLAKARRLTRTEWDSRPMVKRLYEAILRPLGPLL